MRVGNSTTPLFEKLQQVGGFMHSLVAEKCNIQKE